MTDKRPAIEIRIEHSIVEGDVIAGDKTEVHVHLHEAQLSSVDAIDRALGELGLQAEAADEVIQRLLRTPDLLVRFDAARKAQNQDKVNQQLDELIREHERLGTSPAMLSKLREAIDASRSANDWPSFGRTASAFLALSYNTVAEAEFAMTLADELVQIATREASLLEYVPVARACQARVLYLFHTSAVMELRTALAVRERLTVKMPLINLLHEHKQALGFLALCDEYSRQAVDLAFDGGRPKIVIFVLFAVIAVQEHVYFHRRYSLGLDAFTLADRVRRSYLILDQFIERFGSASDKAMHQSNLANFMRQTGEFGPAEVLATTAAKVLAKLGDAHGAARALEIAELARNHAPVFNPPSDADVRTLTVDQLAPMLRETSERLLRLQGIDPTVSPLKEELETAWRDFNPELVMRYCSHIVVDYEASELGQAVGIPSLGAKILGCDHFQRELKVSTLGAGFEQFKSGLRCESCPHRSPRATDWKWDWAKDS